MAIADRMPNPRPRVLARPALPLVLALSLLPTLLACRSPIVPGTSRDPSPAIWRLGGAVSDDGGATWTEGLVPFPGERPERFEGDPMAAWDPRSGDSWIGGVRFYTGGGVYVARRPRGSAWFEEPVEVHAESNAFYDKPLMTAGPAPGSPDETRLYVVHARGLHSSTDLGQTWSPPVDLGEERPEVGHQPRVDAAGTLYILSWDREDGIWLRRSTDGGATVGPRRSVATRMGTWDFGEGLPVPGSYRVFPLPSLAIAGDGTLHVVWSDVTEVVDDEMNLDVYLTSSTDGGESWSAPVIVNGDADPPGDQFNPWIETDGRGRLHVVYHDTGYHSQSDDAPAGLVDVTYAVSEDGGTTWAEARVTDTSTSSSDAVWVGGTVEDYQFLGDYFGQTVTANGDVVVLYAAAPDGDLDIFSRRIEIGEPGCVPDDHTICLRDRFAVSVDWKAFDGKRGRGTPVGFSGGESAHFWFFQPSNSELFVKVLDGCPIGGTYWVFWGATSNVEYTLRVVDTLTGQEMRWENPLRHVARPVAATNTIFGSCAGETSGTPALEVVDTRDDLPANGVPEIEELVDASIPDSCVVSETRACLAGNRFRVRGEFVANGEAGVAKVEALTGNSGVARFFSEKNVELFFKVLDGCPVNGKRWAFVTGLTDVEVDLFVEDTVTKKTYRVSSPAKSVFPTSLDVDTFFEECEL